MAEQLLGERGLTDPGQLDRALDIGQAVDRRVAADERIPRESRREPERLARNQPVEALRRLAGARRRAEQPSDRTGPAGRLLGASRPIITPGAKLALLGKLRHLLESGRGRIEVGEAPGGEGGDPGSLAGPVSGGAHAPGVRHSAGVRILSEHIIYESDAGRGLRSRFEGKLGRVGVELGFSTGSVVGLDQSVKESMSSAPYLLQGARWGYRIASVAGMVALVAGYAMLGLGQLGRLGDERLKRSDIDDRRAFGGVEFGLCERGQHAPWKRGNARLGGRPIA